MTSASEHLTALLDCLAQRANAGATTDFGAAVGLVNDLGRVIVSGGESDIRQAQAATSVVREQLARRAEFGSPAQALVGMQSSAFLGGALWAVSEIMTIRLDAMPQVPEGRVTRRDRVRDLVLGALIIAGEPQTPTAILDSMIEPENGARLDEVSRALTDALVAGLVESVTPQSGTDRRMKYFALTALGREIADERAAPA